MAEKVVIPPVEHSSLEVPSPSPDTSKNGLAASFDPKLERRLLRKVDFHLMVPLWIVFLLGFVDRINLGNVAVLGIVKDLDLTGNKLNVCLQVFFVSYILVEIPSNLMLRRIAPSTWISSLSFLWGVTCMCQGFCHTEGALVACRIFLGLFEGGFVPGCAYLMAMYYKRHEFQKRFSLFWCAGLMAGAFGGLLAYALNHMKGISGFAGWRWIFIIEGLISIAFAPIAKLVLADWPEKAKFLSAEEKECLHTRMAVDVGGTARMDTLNKQAWISILTDWKIIVGAFMYIGITVSGYATALFVPTIVASLGYSGTEAQVQSIPIWICSAVVCFAFAVVTDRLKHRYGFIMFGLAFASIGYIVLLCQGPLAKPHHPQTGLALHVRLMAVYFVVTGCYIVQPAAIVWLANNLSGHYKRAVGLAIQVGFGNIGGIIASNIFVKVDAPRYYVGYGLSLAMLVFCGAMATTLAVGVHLENKRRERGERDSRLQWPAEKLDNAGDDDPRFRFAL